MHKCDMTPHTQHNTYYTNYLTRQTLNTLDHSLRAGMTNILGNNNTTNNLCYFYTGQFTRDNLHGTIYTGQFTRDILY